MPPSYGGSAAIRVHVGARSGVVHTGDGVVVGEVGVVDGVDGTDDVDSVDDVRVTATVMVADCFSHYFSRNKEER